MFVSGAFITTLMRSVPMLLVYNNTNNGDKTCHRKSMWEADEKLIINKLEPNGSNTFKLSPPSMNLC